MNKRFVIVRDDDTSALTPVACLETLYRPFLDRGLPVTLALIPEVATGTRMPDGQSEGYIRAGREVPRASVPIGDHPQLTEYLRANPNYRIAQHGHRHSWHEFASGDRASLGQHLDRGRELIGEAGLGRPRAFVAPYDQFCGAALREIAGRFQVFSTGWFDRRRIPISWLPRYAMRKLGRHSHWNAAGLMLLTHPGCLLSCHRDPEVIAESVRRAVASAQLTVLVTHWWEYFREGRPDGNFIARLHEVGEWLAGDPGVEVISFDDLDRIPIRGLRVNS